MYALAKHSPLFLEAALETLMRHRACRSWRPYTRRTLALGVLSVKPYCRNSGSFSNYLVYLPRARTVKKTRARLVA
jgi:hypothetical protein